MLTMRFGFAVFVAWMLSTASLAAPALPKRAKGRSAAMQRSSAQLYVVLASVADSGGRLDPGLLHLLEEGMRERLGALGGVLARAEELPAAIRQGKSEKRYYVQVRLELASSRSLKMSLLCFTYPRRSLLGEVNVKAEGGQPAALIKALAPRAIDEAAETFRWNS